MAPAGGGPSTPVSVGPGEWVTGDRLPVQPLVGAASRPILAEPAGSGQRIEGAGPRGAVLVRGHPRQHEDYLLARRAGELARGEGSARPAIGWHRASPPAARTPACRTASPAARRLGSAGGGPRPGPGRCGLRLLRRHLRQAGG